MKKKVALVFMEKIGQIQTGRSVRGYFFFLGGVSKKCGEIQFGKQIGVLPMYPPAAPVVSDFLRYAQEVLDAGFSSAYDVSEKLGILGIQKPTLYDAEFKK